MAVWLSSFPAVCDEMPHFGPWRAVIFAACLNNGSITSACHLQQTPPKPPKSGADLMPVM